MKGVFTPAINKIRDDDDEIVVENPMNKSRASGSASDSSGGFESVDITSIE